MYVPDKMSDWVQEDKLLNLSALLMNINCVIKQVIGFYSGLPLTHSIHCRCYCKLLLDHTLTWPSCHKQHAPWFSEVFLHTLMICLLFSHTWITIDRVFAGQTVKSSFIFFHLISHFGSGFPPVFPFTCGPSAQHWTGHILFRVHPSMVYEYIHSDQQHVLSAIVWVQCTILWLTF